MAEKLDTYIINTFDRSDVHKFGLLHISVHCYIIDIEKRKILLQKRSANKDSFPGGYDISCAGHVTSGGHEIEAMAKELKEELGLDVDVNDLKFLFRTPYYNKTVQHDEEFIDNEINYIYALPIKNLDITKLTLQEEEVELVEWFDFEDVKEDNPKFVMSFKLYNKAMECIEKIL